MSHPTPSSDRPPSRISRRLLLGGAAGALGTGIAGSFATPALAGHGPTPPLEYPPVWADGIKITKIKNLTGPGITTKYGLDWVDLGAVTRTPDGRSLYVFGDSFSGANWGDNWRSPTALWSNTRNHLERGVTFSGSVGGVPAAQLIPYEHGEEISTIIPSDVITLGNKIYLHAVVNQGFGNVIWSGIWVSSDNGATWHDSGARFDGHAHNKMWNLCTWEYHEGWVYVYTAEFLRESPMILHRVRPKDLTDPDKWEPWGRVGNKWKWGAGPDTVIDDIIGEMSLRKLGKRWVFTWFDGPRYRISAMVLDHPTQDLRKTDRVTLLHGTSWSNQDANHVAQLYGSYVIPGSTMNDLHLTVSQWNTSNNSVYHVSQYRFENLGNRL
jgi:hypothetical protein